MNTCPHCNCATGGHASDCHFKDLAIVTTTSDTTTPNRNEGLLALLESWAAEAKAEADRLNALEAENEKLKAESRGSPCAGAPRACGMETAKSVQERERFRWRCAAECLGGIVQGIDARTLENVTFYSKEEASALPRESAALAISFADALIAELERTSKPAKCPHPESARTPGAHADYCLDCNEVLL